MFSRFKHLRARAIRRIRERLSGDNDKGTYVILEIGKCSRNGINVPTIRIVHFI